MQLIASQPPSIFDFKTNTSGCQRRCWCGGGGTRAPFIHSPSYSTSCYQNYSFHSSRGEGVKGKPFMLNMLTGLINCLLKLCCSAPQENSSFDNVLNCSKIELKRCFFMFLFAFQVPNKCVMLQENIYKNCNLTKVKCVIVGRSHLGMTIHVAFSFQ